MLYILRSVMAINHHSSEMMQHHKFKCQLEIENVPNMQNQQMSEVQSVDDIELCNPTNVSDNCTSVVTHLDPVYVVGVSSSICPCPVHRSWLVSLVTCCLVVSQCWCHCHYSKQTCPG